MRNPSSAFSFLEVIMAMTLLLSTITVIMRTQFDAIIKIWQGREDLDRVFLLQKEFQDNYTKITILKNQGVPGADDVTLMLSDAEQITKNKFLSKITPGPMEKKVEKPQMKISSQLTPISKKSELKDFANHIKILRSEATWESEGREWSLEFLGFVLYFDEE